jgi:hypothetical protein
VRLETELTEVESIVICSQPADHEGFRELNILEEYGDTTLAGFFKYDKM